MTQRSRAATEPLRIMLPIIILGVAVAGFVGLKNLKKSPAADATKDLTTAVETVAVIKHEDEVKIVVNGEVVPFREVNIAAEVSGRVIEKKPICETGTYVNRGDVLFKIDDADYLIEERRLAKELEQAEAYIAELGAEIEGTLRRLQIAGLEVASAEEEYQRQSKLKGIVSDSQIDKVKRDWLAAQNAEIQVRNLHQLLESRKLRLISAKELVEVQQKRAALDVERTTISSPSNGVITSEFAQQDGYVQKGATLLTIEDTSRAEITCQLLAEDEQWIWLSHPDLRRRRDMADEPTRDYELPRTKATVIFKRGRFEYQWEGVLTRYDGLGFDAKTRSIPCRVEVEHPRREKIVGPPSLDHNYAVGPRALVHGMYVDVELHTQPQVDLFQIPIGAVRPGKVLWLVRDGKLTRTTVDIVQHDQVGDTDQGMVVVYSPGSVLKAGDQVVVSPLSYPHEGLAVTSEKAAQ
jgi:multidrug efflux pump subunit AcrA (membrane-fusion protein)